MILRLRRAWILAFGLLVVACTSQPDTAKSPDPVTTLQAIPPANAADYEGIRDMKKWRNPYLIVRTDGVALYDSDDSVEILLKTDELLPALAHLPASNWPYGRVVAATEISARASEQDGIAIRRNKGIVGGLLEGAHISVRWVPSS